MSEIKINMITKPDYDNLTVAVSIPSPERDHIIMSKDIYSAEERYIAKRDESDDVQEKICYDRARAVIKWASSCGATIKSQRVEQGQLHFVFGFPALEQLKEFHKNASINISGATMTAEDFAQAKKGIQVNMITYPDYSNLTTTVSVPFPEQDQIIMSQDIHSAEESYIAKRDESDDVQKKICYDRARAVCKWASSCGATMKYQRVQDGKLYLSFSFSSAEQLKEFEESASINIGGATMTAEHFEQENGIRR
jgi:hypothetical protein